MKIFIRTLLIVLISASAINAQRNKKPNSMWMNTLSQISNKMKELNINLNQIKGQKEFIKGVAQTQIDKVKGEITSGAIANGKKLDDLDNELEKGSTEMAKLVKKYSNLLAKANYNISNKAKNFVKDQGRERKKAQILKQNERTQARIQKQIENAKKRAGKIIANAKNSASKKQKQMDKRRENMIKNLNNQLAKAKIQRQAIINKAKMQKNNIINKAKAQKKKILKGGKDQRNKMILKAKNQTKKMVQDQQKRLANRKEKVLKNQSMMLKRRKKLILMKMNRKNHSKAAGPPPVPDRADSPPVEEPESRPEIIVDPLPPVPPTVEMNTEMKQQMFKQCSEYYRSYFNRIQSLVHDEVVIDFEFEVAPPCSYTPLSATLREGECFDNVLKMYTVLSKEIKVYLDPLSMEDYETVVTNINIYSEFLVDIANTCGATIEVKKSDTTNTELTPQCLASHENAFSKFSEEGELSDSPYQRWEQISNNLSFALNEINMKKIQSNCTN